MYTYISTYIFFEIRSYTLNFFRIGALILYQSDPKCWYPCYFNVSAQDCISRAPKCDYGTKVPGSAPVVDPECPWGYGLCLNMAENETYHTTCLF